MDTISSTTLPLITPCNQTFVGLVPDLPDAITTLVDGITERLL